MTSHRPPLAATSGGHRPTRRAFTLVEVLVVVAIIAILLTLVVTVSGRAFRTADRTRLGYQLQTIEHALDAYKADFSYLPTTSIRNVTGDLVNERHFRGARTLCKALMGQSAQQKWKTATVYEEQPNQDGAEGFGFRVPPKSGVFRITNNAVPGQPYNEISGKIRGPYLAPDRFSVAKLRTADAAIDTLDKDYDDSCVLLDLSGNPILYYPVLNSQPNFAIPRAYIGSDDDTMTAAAGLPMYRPTDNDWPKGTGGNGGLSADNFRLALGDKDKNGAISNGETAAVKNQYILWLAGPDGFFGPNPAKPTENDDVTNFQ